MSAILNAGAYSKQIKILGNAERSIREILQQERRRHHSRTLVFLDVGGRQAERRGLAEGMEYRSIDIAPKSSDVIRGDICNCPEIPDGSFDVVASFEVFEHLKEPWKAAEECVRITKPGGLLIHRAPFAYRYHPCPMDFYRYSAQGLRYLFERTGRIDSVILSGYDLRRRRWDSTKTGTGGWPSGNDIPPVDEMGGFIENWLSVLVARKSTSVQSNGPPSSVGGSSGPASAWSAPEARGERSNNAERARVVRKLRKLLRDPRAFLRDALEKRRRRF